METGFKGGKKPLTAKDQATIERFLEENEGKFFDDKMTTVFHTKVDSYVFGKMAEASFNIGVYVDEVRLKRWAEFCISLDNINPEECKDIAIKNRLYRLEAENRRLREDNERLQCIVDTVTEAIR